MDGRHTVFGKVISEDDQTVVNSIVQGDKIENITIDGDVSELYKAVPELLMWNQTLDDTFDGLKPS